MPPALVTTPFDAQPVPEKLVTPRRLPCSITLQGLPAIALSAKARSAKAEGRRRVCRLPFNPQSAIRNCFFPPQSPPFSAFSALKSLPFRRFVFSPNPRRSQFTRRVATATRLWRGGRPLPRRAGGELPCRLPFPNFCRSLRSLRLPGSPRRAVARCVEGRRRRLDVASCAVCRLPFPKSSLCALCVLCG